MKNITTEHLQSLLSIIQEAPMQRIGHFTNSNSELSAVLSKFCQTNRYEYILNSTNSDNIEYLKEKYKDFNLTKIKFFDLERKSYLQNGLFYEYLFVSTEIPDAQKNIFLQKSHKCIKNAGLIVIFTTNSQSEYDLWYRLLEKNYFVATNKIQLDDSNCVIISKKMHGWGG